MRFSAIILFVLTYLNSFGQHNLYPAIKDNKFGYVNSKGEFIIQPQFVEASQFSGGLACIRKHGTYGFIDINGVEVIPCQFDVKANFYQNFALVQKDGKRFLIDRQGREYLKDGFRYINKIPNEELFVVNDSLYMCGLIDLLGEYKIPLQLNQLYYLTSDRLEARNDDWDEDSTLIIDFQGQVIASGNYFKVYWMQEDGVFQCYSDWYSNDEKFELLSYDGLKLENLDQLSMRLRHPYGYRNLKLLEEDLSPIPEEEVKSSFHSFPEDTILQLTAFEGNVAYGQLQNFCWVPMNQYGNRIGTNEFDTIISCKERFTVNSFSIFSVSKKQNDWIASDSLGNFKSIDSDFIHNSQFNAISLLFMKNGDDFRNSKVYSLLSDSVLYDSVMYLEKLHDIAILRFSYNRIIYLNKNLDVVFEGPKRLDPSHNITYKDFYYRMLESDNREHNKSQYYYLHEIDRNILHTSDAFSIFIDTSEIFRGNNGLNYQIIQLSNAANKPLTVSTTEGNLNIILQVKNKEGEWCDIESNYNRHCGHSYYAKEIPSFSYVKFPIPIFLGEIETLMRAKVQVYDDALKSYIYMYSNEVSTFINPGQIYNDERIWNWRAFLED